MNPNSYEPQKNQRNLLIKRIQIVEKLVKEEHHPDAKLIAHNILNDLKQLLEKSDNNP